MSLTNDCIVHSYVADSELLVPNESADLAYILSDTDTKRLDDVHRTSVENNI